MWSTCDSKVDQRLGQNLSDRWELQSIKKIDTWHNGIREESKLEENWGQERIKRQKQKVPSGIEVERKRVYGAIVFCFCCIWCRHQVPDKVCCEGVFCRYSPNGIFKNVNSSTKHPEACLAQLTLLPLSGSFILHCLGKNNSEELSPWLTVAQRYLGQPTLCAGMLHGCEMRNAYMMCPDKTKSSALKQYFSQTLEGSLLAADGLNKTATLFKGASWIEMVHIVRRPP